MLLKPQSNSSNQAAIISAKATEWSEEVRVTQRADGAFTTEARCLRWLEHMGEHLASLVGRQPRIQMFAYANGPDTLLAVDVESSSNREVCLNMTILLCRTGIRLCGPINQQLDIAVPGTIDAFAIVSYICQRTQGSLTICAQ